MRRLTDRLVSLGPQRVARSGPDGVTPAARVRAVLQHLADAAADAEQRPRRAVPVLADRTLGDQLVVLVDDLLAAVPPDDETVVDDVHDRLVALRRSL